MAWNHTKMSCSQTHSNCCSGNSCWSGQAELRTTMLLNRAGNQFTSFLFFFFFFQYTSFFFFFFFFQYTSFLFFFFSNMLRSFFSFSFSNIIIPARPTTALRGALSCLRQLPLEQFISDVWRTTSGPQPPPRSNYQNDGPIFIHATQEHTRLHDCWTQPYPKEPNAVIVATPPFFV